MRIIPETCRVRLRSLFYYYKTISKILLPWSLRKRQIDDVMLGINVGILTLKSNNIFVLKLGDRYFFYHMVIDYYNLKNQIHPPSLLHGVIEHIFMNMHDEIFSGGGWVTSNQWMIQLPSDHGHSVWICHCKIYIQCSFNWLMSFIVISLQWNNNIKMV